MILLDTNQYNKLIDLLNKVTFNHLFAGAVIDGRVKGRVYVDNVESPQTCYLVHSYGMSLLFGDYNNRVFNQAFAVYALNSEKARNDYEWMQVYPDGWNTILEAMFARSLVKSSDAVPKAPLPVIQLNTRVNFKFNEAKFLRIEQDMPDLEPGIMVVQDVPGIYNDMKGSVVPAHFWDTAEDFSNYGTAFSLYHNGDLASTAFSSFRAPGQLELGIETTPSYRALGHAQIVCAALIRYCIDRCLEPVWACRLENTGSYKLAEKLGFEDVLQMPYYRLSN